MIPSSSISTRLLGLSDIDVRGTDLYDDAWGFSQAYTDVFRLLSLVEVTPPDTLVETLLQRVREGEGS